MGVFLECFVRNMSKIRVCNEWTHTRETLMEGQKNGGGFFMGCLA
jgi:hypothetical protein